MRLTPLRSLLPAALLLAGCYHATVTTGATPSTVTVDNKWASSWIYGLVPPSTVETAAKCPTGVARVETRLSFLNQLVGLLTLGIYTPMDIRVTCAEGASADATVVVPAGSPDAVWAGALQEAVHRSRDGHQAVYVVAGD